MYLRAKKRLKIFLFWIFRILCSTSSSEKGDDHTVSEIKERIRQEVEKNDLRRRQIISETEETITDVTTGEIVQRNKTTKSIGTSEPDFIKIYYKSMLVVQGIEEVPLDFVLALSHCLSYSDDKQEPVVFVSNKHYRNRIAGLMEHDGKRLSDNMVSRYIKRAVDVGLLFPVKGCRGTYEVNPCLIAKGKWEYIKALQANFDFVGNKWERRMVLSE